MIPKLKLSSGKTIPQVGLGLWQVTNEKDFMLACKTAVEAGYQHFDTAQIYKNEQLLGKFLAGCKQSRKDFFITTKIFPNNFGYDKTLKSFSDSLEKLQTDYVDLLLLHWPMPGKKASWRALEELHHAGKAKSIGVSNYSIRHLEAMKKYANTLPSVNQVELHLFLQQPELISYCRENNIVVEAYSPLARAKRMDNGIVAGIAKKHKKSYAQIMLRWLIEQELVVIPKSVTPSRIKENADIFDFKLDASDLEELADLPNQRTLKGPNLLP